jgi:hypothetical protein
LKKKLIVLLAIGILAVAAIGITLPFFSTDFACLSCGCDDEPQCPTSLPPAELAVCQAGITQTHQAINTQAYAAAFTVVAQTVTSSALSATPTPTASATPTVTPTHTPVPTSTTWRVEPVATTVSYTHIPLDVYGIENLPSSIGKSVTFSQEQKNVVGEKIVAFMKEHNIQNPFYGEAIFINELISADLDGDGRNEMAVSYTLANKGVLYDFPNYGVGVAVLKNQDIIAVTPPEIKGEFTQTRLVPVQISHNQVGLLYHAVTTTSGSGLFPYIYRKIFILEDGSLKTIWDWNYFGGSKAGSGYQKFSNEKIEVKYLTGQSHVDIFLSRQTTGWGLGSDNPTNYFNYDLHLPGGFVFSWNGEKYALSHYYDGKALTPIRAADFIVHAPRIETGSIMQIEYHGALEGYGFGNRGRSVEAMPYDLAWDEKSLYMNVSVYPVGPIKKHSTVWIALDTDLQGDFDNHVLNEDDRLLKIEVENPAHCDKDLSVQMVYPHVLSIPFENHSQLESCEVKLVIPLGLLGLDIPTPKQPAKILKFMDDAWYPLHQYFPQSAKTIGFAVFSENTEKETLTALKFRQWLHLLPFDSQDPTTWGTLIFMSDH